MLVLACACLVVFCILYYLIGDWGAAWRGAGGGGGSLGHRYLGALCSGMVNELHTTTSRHIGRYLLGKKKSCHDNNTTRRTTERA